MVCCCCLLGCDPKTSTIVLGIITTLNYFIQLLVITVNENLVTADFSAEQYNAFLFNHVLLLLISLVLLVGAIQENKWLLLPFMTFMILQDLASFVTAVIAAQLLLASADNNGILGLLLVSIFNCVLLTWVLSIVIDYFRLLHYGYKSFIDEEAGIKSGQKNGPAGRD